MASDRLNQVGKYINKTRKDADLALAKHIPNRPQIERARDLFDSATPFEMEFTIGPNISEVKLDISFTSPPQANGCEGDCLKAKCEEFRLEAGSHYITLEHPATPGTIKVFKNGTLTDNWDQVNNNRLYIGYLSSSTLIVVCYFWGSLHFDDFNDRDELHRWGTPTNMNKCGSGIQVEPGVYYQVGPGSNPGRFHENLMAWTHLSTFWDSKDTEDSSYPTASWDIGVSSGVGWVKEYLQADIIKAEVTWPLIFHTKLKYLINNSYGVPALIGIIINNRIDENTFVSSFSYADGTPEHWKYIYLSAVFMDIGVAGNSYMSIYGEGNDGSVEEEFAYEPYGVFPYQILPNKYYQVKFYINLNDFIKIKIWEDGTPEPSEWTRITTAYFNETITQSLNPSYPETTSFGNTAKIMIWADFQSPLWKNEIEIDFIDFYTGTS